jgi:microcystin-dependent protein
MACTDCFNNCGSPGIISDNCVMYTGPNIPLLGICTGDQISNFEAKVANALLTALDGTGITPANVTLANCPTLLALLGNEMPNLANILQLLINNSCTLNTLVANIQAQLNANSGLVWDVGCLQNVATPINANTLLQAVIFQLCSLTSTVTAFPANYVQVSDLAGLVTPIVTTIITASQASGVPQQNAKMVPNVAYEYYGPLSNFDGSGIGITSLGYQKVYICNGSNGTPDKRGRVAVGAVRNVPGGTLDAAVDPATPNNPNWNLLDKAGENFHVLTQNEIPAHTHQVNDPGHSHTNTTGNDFTGNPTGAIVAGIGNPAYPQTPTKTSISQTGINLGSTGGGQGHITYQPSIAANYIMYLP